VTYTYIEGVKLISNAGGMQTHPNHRKRNSISDSLTFFYQICSHFYFILAYNYFFSSNSWIIPGNHGDYYNANGILFDDEYFAIVLESLGVCFGFCFGFWNFAHQDIKLGSFLFVTLEQ
jgi:hypothetical protein